MGRLQESLFATVAALAVHLLVALALINTTRSAKADEMKRGTDTMSVSIIGMQATQPQSTDSEQSILEDLRRQDDRSWLQPAAAQARSLSELWGQSEQPRSQQGNGEAGGGQAYGRVSDPGALASIPRSSFAPRDANGKIAPCWLPTDRPVSAVVRLVLDEHGGVIGQPKFVKQPLEGSSGEVAVMKALSGCAPYGIATKPGNYPVIELDFSRRDNWVKAAGTMEFR